MKLRHIQNCQFAISHQAYGCQMLPVYFLLLFASFGLVHYLRMIDIKIGSSVVTEPLRIIAGQANIVAESIIAQTRSSVPCHDIAMLRREVHSGYINEGINGDSPAGKSSQQMPDVPLLSGIIISSQESALAVLDGRSYTLGDVVRGWRVVQINAESVLIFHDSAGQQKELILYEN